MKPVYIRVQSVASAMPEGEAGNRNINLELNMTREQERAAIFGMLGQWPEQEAFDWLRSEFPEWFGVTA